MSIKELKDMETKSPEVNILDDEVPKIAAMFLLKNQILYQRSYPPTVVFGELISDFEKNFKDPQIQRKIEYIFRNQKINKNDKVIDIAKPEKNFKLLEVDVKINASDLNIPEMISNEVITYKQILKPLNDPFRLITFKPRENKITYDSYEDCKNSQYYLDEFSKSSAYCNSDNSLYMSGGENNEIPNNHFWKINHETKLIEVTEMPFKKFNHSMLFLPNNYIFIAGGNDKSTFYYDINSKIFTIWADMNEKCKRPALILVDGHLLYAFYTLENGKNCIEKTDLRSFPFWEKVNPKMKNGDFNLQNFNVCSVSNNEIILFGGNVEGENQKCFVYDIHNNELNEIESPNEVILNCENKAYKINKYNSVIIPDDFEENKEIVILNNHKKALKRIGYEPIQNKIENQEFVNYSLSDNSQVKGNISLEITIQKLNEAIDIPLDDENTVNEKMKAVEKLSGSFGKAMLGLNLKKLLNKLKEEEYEKVNENEIEIIEEESEENIVKSDKLHSANKKLSK